MARDEDLSVIDWTNVFEAFCRQDDDCSRFSVKFTSKGGHSPKKSGPRLFVKILVNEEWVGLLDETFPYPLAVSGTWNMPWSSRHLP